jgi:hypothetical protein
LPLADRWKAHVLVTDDCWEWQAARFPNGYGQFRTPQEGYAHRVAYELHVGPIPDGYHVHHKCENPGCVRPDHLEVLTPAEHRRRHQEAHDERG